MSSSLGAMLFIVNLPIETDSTVICVPCTLEHVCDEPFHFPYRIADLDDILCKLIKFCTGCPKKMRTSLNKYNSTLRPGKLVNYILFNRLDVNLDFETTLTKIG